MGIKDIMGQINSAISTAKAYYNPIGHFYIQVQLLCRIIITEVFLDDLFKDQPSLKCDSKQPACEQNCINRYSPINHNKLWQFELFLVLLCCTLFSALCLFHDHNVKKHIKKKDGESKKNDDAPSITQYKYYDKKGRPLYTINNPQEGLKATKLEASKVKGKTHSVYTQCAYVFMLVCRFGVELWSLILESQLAKHQSQNAYFWDRFWLKESWYCATNVPDNSESVDRMIPVANRSDYFWTDDLNEPCVQQQVIVTCWIPFSRMKSVGMMFMYFVLLFTWFLTILELIVAVFGLFKFINMNHNSEEKTYIMDKEYRQHVDRYEENHPFVAEMPLSEADEDSLKKTNLEMAGVEIKNWK